MGVWRVTADVLAGSRFAVSPLAETVCALIALRGPGAQPWERAWRAEHAAAFARRVDQDPFAHVLVHQVLGRAWVPDLIAAPPTSPEPGVDDELARVRATPRDVALADLAVPLAGRPLPPALLVPDPAGAVADLLAWVWETTVAPDWRRRRVLHADVLHRSTSLAQHGWAAALGDLSPQVRWLGDGQLRINTSQRPARDLSGAELVLVPAGTTRSWVCWDLPARYAIVQPASGQLLDPGASAPASLRRLIGASRADLLGRSGHPMTTTQLVAVTGLALGTVGHHLRTLHESGLVHRRRAGAGVLYYRSELGAQLVAGAGP